MDLKKERFRNTFYIFVEIVKRVILIKRKKKKTQNYFRFKQLRGT